jgi:hypothetical protein
MVIAPLPTLMQQADFTNASPAFDSPSNHHASSSGSEFHSTGLPQASNYGGSPAVGVISGAAPQISQGPLQWAAVHFNIAVPTPSIIAEECLRFLSRPRVFIVIDIMGAGTGIT